MTSAGPQSNAEEPLSTRLRALIKDRAYSHRRLAADIGASKQSVTNWTQGNSEPSLRHVRELARALGVAPAFLIEGKASQSPREAATDLLRELADLPTRQPLEDLATMAPSLLDLLSRAERHVREIDRRAIED